MTSLRQFSATPAGGEVDGAEWLQTMSRVTISYLLEDASATQDDVEVKITGFQVKVSVKGAEVKPLCKELYDLVRPAPQSWWVLAGGGGGVAPTLIMQFTKKKEKRWPEAWFSGTSHPLKANRFHWTKVGQAEMAEDAAAISLNEYTVMPAGRPEQDETAFYPPKYSSVFSPPSDTYLFSPDDVIVGTSVKQDANKITLEIHLDNDAMEYFTEQKPWDDIFGADITENTVNVFIRGDDQNPIMNATLMGEINPYASSWRVGSSEAFRDRQKSVGTACPTLEITLVKADMVRYAWPKVFDTCWQHRLMVKNQGVYDDAVEANEALKTLDASVDPEFKAALQEAAGKLDTWTEERFEGLPDSNTYRRQGYDPDSQDFWANVYDYVNDSVRNQGYASAPKALSVQ